MFARIVLAMIAMLQCRSAVSCLAATHEVGVYLRSDGGASAPVLDALKAEMDAVLNRAGYRLKWWIGNSKGPFEAEEVVVVDLRGSCNVPPLQRTSHSGILQLELASTFVADSQILPFSSLDCSTFNHLLGTPLMRMNRDLRDFLYGRALARVLAHEFYHVLAHTHKHTSKGVAKKAHSADDLLSDHFDFDAVALAQLRQVNHQPVTAKNQTGPESVTETPAEPVVSGVAVENPFVRQY